MNLSLHNLPRACALFPEPGEPAEEWTDTAPTKAGRYLWRKDKKWEPVYRDLVLRPDGRLYTYSERFLNWVPLSHLEAGGSQWHISTL